MAWDRAIGEFGATIMFVAVRLRRAGDRDTPS
jgi:ABC-type molybdate transport system permease subunit